MPGRVYRKMIGYTRAIDNQGRWTCWCNLVVKNECKKIVLESSVHSQRILYDIYTSVMLCDKSMIMKIQLINFVTTRCRCRDFTSLSFHWGYADPNLLGPWYFKAMGIIEIRDIFEGRFDGKFFDFYGAGKFKVIFKYSEIGSICKKHNY